MSTSAPRFFIAALLLAAATLSGCSAPQRAQSGFLGDYSKLKPSPKVSGALAYRDPSFDLATYNKFIIDPIGIHFAPDATGAAVDPKVLNEMANYFRQKLIEDLSKTYHVTDQRGPGTLQLRIAITDLQKANPMMNIHPATKLSGVGLGSASIEAEGVDANDGRQVFAFVHTRSGDRLALAEGLQEWGHAKQAMDYWSKQLVDRVDEAHEARKTDAK